MRKKYKTSQVRIIGGQARGRNITFPIIDGLRPSSDRIRETLFNWLAPVIQGATCLDLFAGSGALGFEALSRGADTVVMCDQSTTVVEHLRANAKRFSMTTLEIIQAQAPECLASLNWPTPFDIVFLDPPFHQQQLAPTIEMLESQHLLNSTAYIYIETEASLKPLSLPNNWQLIHSKKAGQVAYHLAKRQK